MQCWHCRSTSHYTADCPGRYRGGAVDGTYEEFVARQKRRSCNRHADCHKAELEWVERMKEKHGVRARSVAGGLYIPLNFHCHDDTCEDCFGN